MANAIEGGADYSKSTAWGVVRGLSEAGFNVDHPLDTTAQECVAVGCEQSVVTDTLRVLSFATRSQATRYASARGLDQAGTIVVRFAPPVSAVDRHRYLSAIAKMER